MIRRALLPLLLALGCTSSEAPPTPAGADASVVVDRPHPDATSTSPDATPESSSDASVAPFADAALASADAATAPDAAPLALDASPPPASCESTCVAFDRVARCAIVDGTETWTEEACPNGQGCTVGGCAPMACSDECDLGQDDCRVWDMGRDDWASQDTGRRTEDRARAFEKWLRSDTASLFHGGVVSVKYTSSARTAVDSIYLGDTALHTGLYMAAEASRLAATQSARARATIADLVETFELWFNISGDPGVLATIAAPAGDRRLREWTDWDCGQFDRHCDVSYAGRRYDFVGDPSRDMYVGPMVGLPLAYDALTSRDEPIREKIRAILMTVAEELSRLRTVPVIFEINGARLPRRNLQARFLIPDQREMVDGAIYVSADTGDVSDGGAITGAQEFMPNPSQFFRQLNILSSLPDIPRSSSASMVAAMIRSAIHVTEGVPAYAQRRQALLDFYLNNADGWGNVNDWISLARHAGSHRECGDRYFGYNISFIPAYLWARYEDDPALKARIVQEVVGANWRETSTHKNAFFALMNAGVTPNVDPSVTQMAREQISDFPSPPHVERDVDLTRDPQYSRREPGCTDQVSHDDAVDTGDRPVTYFAWHNSPWLLTAEGDPRQTYPGHDYLLAYWLARAQGVMSPDRAATCLRFDR